MSKINQTIFGLVILGFIGFLAPKFIIRDAPLRAEEIACAKRDAYVLFDNLLDRLFIVKTAVVRKESDVVYVNGYTFGGLKYAEAAIVCDREARVLWRSWLKRSAVGCTMEAKMCPDGSVVGRTGPKCEFAPCPGKKDKDDSSANPAPPVCADKCGDGVCQEVVCMAIGCPCVETPESCAKDCAQKTGILEEYCDAAQSCSEGKQCYKFQYNPQPVCLVGDPCERCESKKCRIAESYPPQVYCE